MYAALNGEVKVCKERVTFPGNKVYHCPYCGTSSLGPPVPTCRCGAVFSEMQPEPWSQYPTSAPMVEASSPDATTSLTGPIIETYEKEDGSQGAAPHYAHPPVRIDDEAHHEMYGLDDEETHDVGPQDAPPLPAPKRHKGGRRGGRR